jgi:hypothetical protein
MTQNSDNEIRVELKYCERCGELWLRLANSRARICGPCTQESPYALLRHRERLHNGEGTSSAHITAGSWYGPMTGIVKRMQGVAVAALSQGLSRGTHSPALIPDVIPGMRRPVLAQDFRPRIPLPQTHESRRDDWTTGGVA